MSETVEMDEVVAEEGVDPSPSGDAESEKEADKESTQPKSDGEPEEEEEDDLTQGIAIQRFLVHVFAGMYTLLLIGFGVVFPVALMLSGGRYRQYGIHLAVFELYIYIVGSGLCVYFIAIIRYEGYKREDELDVTESEEPPTGASGQTVVEGHDGDDVYVINDGPRGQSVPEELQRTLLEAPPIYEGHRGMNLFLRMGLIGFGMASIFQAGMKLLSFDYSLAMWFCYGTLYIASVVFRIIFISIQTFVLFKYHKVAFNTHRPFVRFGLLHLIATNICLWIGVIVIESGGLSNNGNPSNTTSTYADVMCSDWPDDISTRVSTFLFPIIIQYALLAITVTYSILTHIGPFSYHLLLLKRATKSSDMKRKPSLYENQSREDGCRKANTGLFIGVGVLTIFLICICFHMYYRASNEKETRQTRTFMYIAGELSANVVVLVVLVPGYWQISKLSFCTHSRWILGQNLLSLVLLSTYILLIFAAMAAFANSGDISGRLIAASTGVEILSVTLQSGFIFDGLRRCALTKFHVTVKPGRSVVSFLLMANLALWLVATFQMADIYRFPVFFDYYGYRAWALILSIVSPLAMYYRFHSAVCYSEIWMHSYSGTTKESLALTCKENLGWSM